MQWIAGYCAMGCMGKSLYDIKYILVYFSHEILRSLRSLKD